MGRPPVKSVEDKTRIVLAVLRGEVSIASAARREGVSATSIAGVRAQAMDPAGELEDDFAITVASRSTHVLNAPSPAATSSLESAKMIVDRIER